MEVQERVEVPPEVTVEGLKDAAHDGPETDTLATHVFVPPAPLTTVSVHVWPAVGEKLLVPFGPERVPLPRLPVQE